jgi:hypothetical protein
MPRLVVYPLCYHNPHSKLLVACSVIWYVSSNVVSFLIIAWTQVKPQDGVARKVAQLDWIIIEPFKDFTVEGVTFTPVPLIHGEGYIAMGYVFGTTQRIAYLSDVSCIPPDTMQYLLEKPLDLLIVDALFKVICGCSFLFFDVEADDHCDSS